MSSIAIFLALAGGTAFAASQLAKNSVGTKQLKKNAVTAAKLKKNAVTTAKIRNGAVKQAKLAAGSVAGAQIVNGAVTGEKIDAASTPFSRVVGTVKQTATAAWTAAAVYPIGSYTQPLGEIDNYVVGVDINFSAGCGAPRFAIGELLLDAENPSSPTPPNYAGYIFVEDKGAGEVTRRVTPGPHPAGYGSLTQAAPLAPTTHKFDLRLLASSCSSGSGVNITGATVEVRGTKSG
jgi:hypothetical protein